METLFTKHVRRIKSLKSSYQNEIIDTIPWNQQLVGLTGARGVGKTTLLLQYIKKTWKYSRKALYVSLSDINFPYASLYELAEMFVKQGGEHLFLDEIHKFPKWSEELKTIYDGLPELKVCFTGSSILDIYKGKADLSRRALVFDMQGLSFRQFLQIETGQNLPVYSLSEIINNHYEIALNLTEKIKPFEFFENYLRYGYYPFYLESKAYYGMKLSGTLTQIVENDMPYLLNIDYEYIDKIKRFINLLANDIPFKPNISNLAGSVGVSWKTIIHYLRYLHRAKIITIIFPAGKNVSALAKPEKVYLHHPNLIFLFKETIENKGSLRESFFVNQLMYKHEIQIPGRGDFLLDRKYTFEIGGKNKGFKQIADLPDSYVVADDIEIGFENKIPLWLFGFLY
jgi:uncharacterized protein